MVCDLLDRDVGCYYFIILFVCRMRFYGSTLHRCGCSTFLFMPIEARRMDGTIRKLAEGVREGNCGMIDENPANDVSKHFLS